MRGPRGRREEPGFDAVRGNLEALTSLAGQSPRPEWATVTALREQSVADFLAILVTVAVFAVLALVVKGAEKL